MDSSLCSVKKMSDFLAAYSLFVSVVSRRNSFLDTVLTLIRNSKLLFMDLVVVKKSHYFLVAFNAVPKIDRNRILLRTLSGIVRNLLSLFLFRLNILFLLVGRFVFEPLFLIELGEDCIDLALNDDGL
jgi:hypothetical protein